MHVAEAADEDSAPVPEWEGITGRVKQLLKPTDARVQAARQEVAAVTGKVNDVNDKVDEVDGNVEEAMGKLEAVRLDVTEKVDEVAGWVQNSVFGGNRARTRCEHPCQIQPLQKIEY